MITQSTPAKEPPVAFKLELPPAAITEQADVDANRETLGPAVEVQWATKAIADSIAPAMEQIAKNPHLTEAGKRAEATKLALQALPKLNELRAKLDAPDAALLKQAEEVQKTAALAEPTDSDERLAEAFGRAPEQKRRRMLEDALTGKDQRMARALAVAHHSLHGLTPSTQAILQSQLQGEKLDQAAAERVKDVAFKLGTVRRTVSAIINSLESAADSKQLKAAGISTVRRSDFSEAEKIEFIDRHGYKAFTALPA